MSAVSSLLPAGPGQEREQAIANLFLSGKIPSWLLQWQRVPLAAGGHTGVVYVLPDYLGVSDGGGFLRLPMAPLTAEVVASALGGRLPTRKLVNDIHAAATLLPAQPWGPPYDASMESTDRYVAHNAKIEAQRQQLGVSLGRLVSGHKKDVVVTPAMDGAHVCIYGWFTGASPSTAIQGPPANCKSHGLSYADYSHGIRVVNDVMNVDGQQMLVDDVMRDPQLSALVSDAGPFVRTRYSQAQAPNPGVTVASLPLAALSTPASKVAIGFGALALMGGLGALGWVATRWWLRRGEFQSNPPPVDIVREVILAALSSTPDYRADYLSIRRSYQAQFCEWCGRPLDTSRFSSLPPITQVRMALGYCSSACAEASGTGANELAYEIGQPHAVCKVCGERLPSRSEVTAGKRSLLDAGFCSRKCAGLPFRGGSSEPAEARWARTYREGKKVRQP